MRIEVGFRGSLRSHLNQRGGGSLLVLGQRDLSEWDAYVAELEGQGLAGYVDLINKAKDDYAESTS